MKNEPRSNFFEDRADESRPSSCGELTKIFNSVPQLLWSCGPDGQVDVLSEQWRAYFACEPADLKGQGWIRFLHPDDVEKTVHRWQFSIHTGHHLRMQYRMRCSTGDYRWFLAKATPECDPAGKVERWYGCCTDIHDHVVAQQELLRSEAVYRSILEASVDSIKMLGLDGRIQMMNRSAVDSMNYDHAESLAGVEFQSLWPPEARPSIEQALASAQSGEAGRFTAFRPAPSGERKCWDVVITPVIDSIGEVTRLLAISRDVTAERMRSQELLWASEHDPLTGLPNRRAFQAHLKAAVFRAMKSGEKLGLLMIDLDHFKHVNDTLGHPTGDALLRAVSRRLQKVVRADDFVARMGGDEFAVIVENLAGDDVLLRISQSLQASVGMPVRIRERAITCGASIGGAIYPDDATNANDLFKLADTALYNLKAAGRGGTKLFQSGMLEEAERAASQLSVARIALQDSTVLPYFQPKIRLSDNSICGFEALLRWTHPDLGLQLPGTVEEAFKDYELAAKIGDLMQRKVVDSIHGWRRQGVAFGRISINAAPVEFLRDDYSERLLALLERRQIPADLLEIEVTEHALLDSSGRFVGRALDRLKNAGLTIALDDFGTGSSSLSHLRDFPVDVVKIDQSFVQNMAADREIAAIVSAVIGLAHSLGMETVAEGVETPDQLRMLGEFGCHVAQGYLFGRPMPAAGAGAICEARQAA